MKYNYYGVIGSVLSIPIFGINKRGRSKSYNFIMKFDDGYKQFYAVSKNPDRRIKELKKKYGSKLKLLSTKFSFHAYEEKRKLNKI